MESYQIKYSERIAESADKATTTTQRLDNIETRLDDVEITVERIRRELRIIWILLFLIVSGLIILFLRSAQKGKTNNSDRIARFSAMQRNTMGYRKHQR